MANSDRQSFLDRIRVSKQELNENKNNNQSNSEDNTEETGPDKGQRERDSAQEMQTDKTERQLLLKHYTEVVPRKTCRFIIYRMNFNL
mgnify:CR=1 FL=1